MREFASVAVSVVLLATRALAQVPPFPGSFTTQMITTNGAQIFVRTGGRGPAVVLVSSRDCADFGPLVGRSGARGFIAKAELSGAALTALLR